MTTKTCYLCGHTSPVDHIYMGSSVTEKVSDGTLVNRDLCHQDDHSCYELFLKQSTHVVSSAMTTPSGGGAYARQSASWNSALSKPRVGVKIPVPVPSRTYIQPTNPADDAYGIDYYESVEAVRPSIDNRVLTSDDIWMLTMARRARARANLYKPVKLKSDTAKQGTHATVTSAAIGRNVNLQPHSMVSGGQLPAGVSIQFDQNTRHLTAHRLKNGTTTVTTFKPISNGSQHGMLRYAADIGDNIIITLEASIT